jgi:hypothetical protein
MQAGVDTFQIGGCRPTQCRSNRRCDVHDAATDDGNPNPYLARSA